MPNREGHRRFGNVRKRAVRPVPDPLSGTGRADANGAGYLRAQVRRDRALVLIEAQIGRASGPTPNAGKVKLGDYAVGVDHRAARAAPAHGGPVPVAAPQAHRRLPWRRTGRQAVDPRMIREWRATLLPTACPSRWRPRRTGCSARSSRRRSRRTSFSPAIRAGSAAPGRGRGRTAGADRGPGLRAGRAGRPPTGRQHPQDPGWLPAPVRPSRRDADLA